MKLKKLLIAGGNSTLLVWDCPLWQKNQIIKKYLGEVEQIGFVEIKNRLPFLNMMGDELCINGTIALASTLKSVGRLKTSGYTGTFSYKNKESQTEIEFIMPFKRVRDVVLLSGIGYVYKQKGNEISKDLLAQLSSRYNLPAFGALLFKKNKLIPYVYVRQTDSLFKETACGSGSIALNIMKNLESIAQPMGELISVKRSGNRFTVAAKVVRIR